MDHMFYLLLLLEFHVTLLDQAAGLVEVADLCGAISVSATSRTPLLVLAALANSSCGRRVTGMA